MPDKKLRLDSLLITKTERTPEGFLKAAACVTTAGIFEYRNPDGTRRFELRHPDEVFRADSMATLHMKPFVDGHPYAQGGVVTPKNARQLTRGMTGSIAYKEGESRLMVDVVVTDADALSQIEAGKMALSAGYKCDIVEEPGEYEGRHYHARQTNIRYNHVALVKSGRAGKDAKLRLDESLNEIPTPEECPMVKIKLDDGREVEVQEEVAAAFGRVTAAAAVAATETVRADEAEAALVGVWTEAETLKGERDGMKVRLDGLDAEIAERVKSRASLLATASSVLPKAEHSRLDSLTDVQIMASVVRCDAGDPALKLDESNEAYIKGRFEHAVTTRGVKKPAAAASALGAKLNASRADGAEEDELSPEDRAEAKKKALTGRYKLPINGKKAAKK